jgi:hypothetical protein
MTPRFDCYCSPNVLDNAIRPGSDPVGCAYPTNCRRIGKRRLLSFSGPPVGSTHRDASAPEEVLQPGNADRVEVEHRDGQENRCTGPNGFNEVLKSARLPEGGAKDDMGALSGAS